MSDGIGIRGRAFPAPGPVRAHRHPVRCGVLHLAQHREAVRAAAPAGRGADGARHRGRAADGLWRGAGDDPGDRPERCADDRPAGPRRHGAAVHRHRRQADPSTATGRAATSPCRTTRRWCCGPPSCPISPTRSARTSSPPAGRRCSVPTTRRASPSSWPPPAICWPTATLPHGRLRLCFTPDEEIGRGVHADLPKDLAAAVAYTLDGAELGEIVYETFSADAALVTPGCLDPSRLGQGQAGQRPAPRRQDHRRRCRR